jgi:hypothetical protein
VGLVGSRAFAEAYTSLLDASGSRLQWLDDEPRWVARLLHNHSRRGGGIGWRNSSRAGTGLTFSRWAGLGSHRYPIGFSGDVFISWESLRFQPYFTATAANVLFWWSHDIGGHRSHHDAASVDSELYLRWLQWGAHSPILRTHPQPDERVERRPWGHPLPFSEYMLDAFARRTQLVPLLHTKLLRFSEDDAGSHPLRPLYHEWPALDGAYAHRDTFILCDDLLVAPITSPVDPLTLLAERSVWLPHGGWVELTSGSSYVSPAPTANRNGGGLHLKVLATLDEVPVFARAGTVLALAPARASTQDDPSSCPSSSEGGAGDTAAAPRIGAASHQPEVLAFEVYVGAGAAAVNSGFGTERVVSAHGRDDTTTGSYQLSANGTVVQFSVSCTAAEGTEGVADSCGAADAPRRRFRLELKFVPPATSVLPCDEIAEAASPSGTEKRPTRAETEYQPTTVLHSAYDARTLTQAVTFQVSAGHPSDGSSVACVRLTRPPAEDGTSSFVAPLASQARYVGLRRRAHRLKALVDNDVRVPVPQAMPLAVAVNTAARIEASPSTFGIELSAFPERLAEAVQALPAAHGISANTTAIARAWLSL